MDGLFSDFTIFSALIGWQSCIFNKEASIQVVVIQNSGNAFSGLLETHSLTRQAASQYNGCLAVLNALNWSLD